MRYLFKWDLEKYNKKIDDLWLEWVDCFYIIDDQDLIEVIDSLNYHKIDYKIIKI